MRFEYDPAKNRANAAKHGVALSKAEELFESPIVRIVDDRIDYGETRIICYGLIGDRVHCCVYTDRGETRRVISLRKANHEEIEIYHGKLGSG